MNSFIKKSLSALMVLCLMVLCVGLTNAKVKAAEETLNWDLSTDSYANASANEISWTSNYVTMTNVKNGGTSVNNYIPTTKKSTRMYNKNILTITPASGYKINSIVFTASTSSYATAFKNCTWTNGSAAVSASDVTITPTEKTSAIVANITATCGFINVTVKYEADSNNPSVYVTGDTDVIVGAENITFNVTSENIENPSPATWSVSDENIALIGENTGILTPVSYGTVDVVATINGTSSAPFTVKVYPDNTNPITIVEALDICTFTGTAETPYLYTAIGTIKSTDVDTFVITDGANPNPNDITVFKRSHSKIVGERVLITGNLVNYSGTTPEFSGAVTISDVYEVTFDSNGGSDVEGIVDVVAESTIAAPSNPTKDGFTFLGWYNGNIEWNFASDTVATDLTLTAKWVNNNLTGIIANLNSINSYMSMGYTYDATLGTGNSDVLAASNFPATSTVYTNFTGVTSNSTAVYAGNSAQSSSNAIQLRSSNSTAGIITTNSGGSAKKVTVVWNSTTTAGRTLNIYGSNTAYTGSNASALYGNSAGDLIGTIVCGTSTELVINADYAYIGLRSASGAMYIDSITIEWGGASTFNNVDFRIRCGIDKSLSSIAAELEGATYGIQVSDGTTTKCYASTNTLYQVEAEENGKAFVIIQLGDLLNNKDRLDTEFTVQAYIEYEGEKYYSSQSKTYSVVTLLQAYIDLNDAGINTQIAGFKSILESFGKTFTVGGEE